MRGDVVVPVVPSPGCVVVGVFDCGGGCGGGADGGDGDCRRGEGDDCWDWGNADRGERGDGYAGKGEAPVGVAAQGGICGCCVRGGGIRIRG